MLCASNQALHGWSGLGLVELFVIDGFLAIGAARNVRNACTSPSGRRHLRDIRTILATSRLSAVELCFGPTQLIIHHVGARGGRS